MNQVDGVSDMVSLLCEGGLRKGTMATAWALELCPEGSCIPAPDARHFSFSPYATGALQAAALVLEPRESESALSPKSAVGPLRGDA